jgi:hypothetical protein
MGLRPITYNLDVGALAEKLGEDIIPNKEGKIIKGIPGIETINTRHEKSNKREFGFVAQEVEELASRLGYDFSGVEVPDNEKDLYRLRYAEFVVPLVKAVQEQQEMIEELRAEIDEIKRGKNN